MKSISFYLSVIILVFWTIGNVTGQNVNYSVTITELYADADANDGGFNINDQDPVWWIYLMDNGTTGTSLTTFQNTGCICTTNSFGTWWSGNPNHSGPTIPYAWLNITNTDANQLITEMEGWEDDCSPWCDYNPNPSLWSSCLGNGDDNHDGRGISGNINFQNDPPCQNNEYEIFIGDYRAKIEVYWEYISPFDAGSIDGDQSVCSTGDPTVLGSVSAGSPSLTNWATYQWQESIGCTGTFTDITGATNATYDPPAGIIQNTCYQRLVVTNCSNIASNLVTVSIETPSSDPSSVLTNPSSICGNGTVDLSVNGGLLGTGGQWVWYNGDPNAGGILIGNGNPLNGNSISATTNFYVRAEGNCDTSNTANQLVSVETNSMAPTSITSTQTTICEGSTIDLTSIGGTLGTNANYSWYDQNPITSSIAPIFTSTSVNYTGVSPLTSTTYYVRAEGCDTTLTASISIIVETLSIDPTGINATIPTVCAGDPTVLSIQGGSLGTGADWHWYEGGCGAGTSLGTGTQITVNPTIQTTYYVRAEGTCNTTNCTSITILVSDLSIAATAIIPSASNICPGNNSLLSISGGSLGTGATWEWYSGSCGGVPIGSGASVSVNPSTTTNYFVRAEGTCNSTSCTDIIITVDQLSTDPTSISTSSNNICSGTTITLDALGGSLGTGATYEWYSGSCGGIYIGSGNSIPISPTVTTTYYVRAEGTCNTTNCTNITIVVEPTSTVPTNVTATNTSICPGNSSTLTVSGGFLAPNDNYIWYENGCGTGSQIGSGTQITVSPSISTTYYVRAEGSCGNTNCINIQINLNTTSITPASIIASNTTICPGQNAILTVSGGSLGTGANWEWYSGSCGGTYIGTGNSVSVSPASTTTYYVRAEGTCGNTSCVSSTITVGAGVPAPSSAQVTTNNICPGDQTSVYVTGNTLPSGYTYVWYTGACGAVPIGVGDTITISPNSTETYYVAAVGTCGSTSCAQVDVVVLNGNIAPSGISSNNNNYCIGDSSTLTVIGGSLVAGANWTWYENSCGGNLIGNGSSITVTPSGPTSYFVRGEGGACGSSICENIFISIQDVVVHMNPFDTLCGSGFPFNLVNGEPSGGYYTGPGVTNGIFDPSIAGVGTHSINYTYTSSNGCSGTASRDLVIIESTLAGEIIIDQLPCSEGGVTLTANVTGGNGFLFFYWNDGIIDNPRFYVQEGIYNVMIQDSKECLLSLGDVEVTEEMDCFEIPNTFTPNTDGTNDTWNLDFSNYTSLNLEIYSRWGRLVWKSTDLVIHWDGRSIEGTNLPSGTYYYILQLDNNEKSQTGPIILLR